MRANSLRIALIAVLLVAPSHGGGGSFYIDVRDPPYSANCTPGIDNSATIQLALNAAAAQKLMLLAPPGGCDIGSELHVNGVSIFGAGPGVSGFRMLSATQNGIVVTSGTPQGGGAVIFRDFFITSAVAPTAGAALLVNPGGTNVNTGSRFENVAIPAAWDAMDFERAAFWTVKDPMIGEPTFASPARVAHRGIVIRNLVQEDYGDSLITGGLIATGPGSLDGIYQESSAGLKVIGVKVVGAPQNCFHFSMQSAIAMGPLIVETNSLEGCLLNGIFLEQGRGGLSVNGVALVGNQIGCGGSSGCIGINTTTIDGTAWLRNPTISGNSIMISQTTSAGGIIVNGMDNATITGNAVFNNNPPGSLTYGFIVSAQHKNGYIGKNSAFGFLVSCVIAPSALGATIRSEAATPCL